MITENQIREKLILYLSQTWSLDQFEDWLVEKSWNMHKDSEASAQRLASQVELRLAEHSAGHLDEQELRRELIPLVINYTSPLHLGNVEQSSFTGAENTTVSPRTFIVQEEQGLLFQPLSDISRAVVSV
jgi:hypothetical protein